MRACCYRLFITNEPAQIRSVIQVVSVPRQNYNLITGFANHYLHVLNVKDSFVLPTFELIFHEYI